MLHWGRLFPERRKRAELQWVPPTGSDAVRCLEGLPRREALRLWDSHSTDGAQWKHYELWEYVHSLKNNPNVMPRCFYRCLLLSGDNVEEISDTRLCVCRRINKQHPMVVGTFKKNGSVCSPWSRGSHLNEHSLLSSAHLHSGLRRTLKTTSSVSFLNDRVYSLFSLLSHNNHPRKHRGGRHTYWKSWDFITSQC